MLEVRNTNTRSARSPRDPRGKTCDYVDALRGALY